MIQPVFVTLIVEGISQWLFSFASRVFLWILSYAVRIYYNYDGVSSVGSHKPNMAVLQAWYNAKAGVKK